MSTILCTGLIVDWVGAIQIFSRWDAVAVSVPDRPRVICSVQPMGIGVLPEPVEIRVRRKGRPEIEILTLEDKRRPRRVKDSLTILSSDSEAEGGLRVVESKP